MIELGKIIEDIKVFKKYYKNARLVDPILKRVINVENPSPLIEHETSSETCFQIWSSGHICENCISYRAVLEGDTVVKFEEANGKIYMITALPIALSNRIMAIELYKEVARNDILESILAQSLDKSTNLHTSIIKLNELVVRDALTNIYNRRYINEKLPIEMIRASIEKVPMSIIMADIDYFKKINDNYGHIVGDEVLKAFADEMTKHIRSKSEDWVARYGGEEFLICMFNCDKKTSCEVAERLRDAVEKMEIATTAGKLKITASFGVHTFLDNNIDASQLLDLVDKNLYQAKCAGRSCVIAT